MTVVLALLWTVPTRAWAAIVVVLAVVAALAGARQAGRREGADTVLLNVERANHAVEQRADRAGDLVDRCVAGGGRWLRDSGACRPSVRGDR